MTVKPIEDFERWLDPLLIACRFIWIGLYILVEPMIEHNPSKAAPPIDMRSKWLQLRRPAAVLLELHGCSNGPAVWVPTMHLAGRDDPSIKPG